MNKKDSTIRSALESLAEEARERSLTDIYFSDEQRFRNFSLETGCLLYDFSKQRIDDQILRTLCSWAAAEDIFSYLNQMMSGAIVNTTESRPALHTVLRAPDNIRQKILKKKQYIELTETDSRMKNLSEKIDSGDIRGEENKHYTDIIVLGIGGSVLGPKFIYEALLQHHKVELDIHFISSLNDGSLSGILRSLDCESTLVITVSKTFTTQETIQNSIEVREWFFSSGIPVERIAEHFYAVTAAPEKAKEIDYIDKNIFPIWDWVGGRFSLWSAVGLPIILGMGWDVFDELRQGAHSMDNHAVTAQYETNLPVVMALLSIWNREYLGSTSSAVLPYGDNMRSLPDYLQQLEMESNGKQVCIDGHKATIAPASIIWGREGSNAQHSFMQRVHQCNDLVPVDFVLGIPEKPVSNRAIEILVSNCIAQSEALMIGRDEQSIYTELVAKGEKEDRAKNLAAHKSMPGNNPSSTLIMNNFSPFCLGSLLALYEAKVIIEARLMNINPFDQWGVELGKIICNTIESHLTTNTPMPESSPSEGLVNYLRSVFSNKSS